MKTCKICDKKYLWFHDEKKCKINKEIELKQKNCKHTFYSYFFEKITPYDHIKFYECSKCKYRSIFYTEIR